MLQTDTGTLALFVSLLTTVPAYAADKSVALLLATDVRSAASSGLLGASGDASGAIHYPDQSLAYPISETPENKPLLDAWKTSHRFFVVPLEISLAPKSGLTAQRVNVSLAFIGLGSMDKQPLVIDVFPKTEFTPRAISANGEVKLGAELKFEPDVYGAKINAGATAGISGAVVYKYTPKFPNVISGYGSGTAFWQLVKTQDSEPVGGLPLKLVVACPIASLAKDLLVTADIRVDYDGPWWTTGISVASFRTKISFPPEAVAK